jgi:hypothetical protein
LERQGSIDDYMNDPFDAEEEDIAVELIKVR